MSAVRERTVYDGDGRKVASFIPARSTHRPKKSSTSKSSFWGGYIGANTTTGRSNIFDYTADHEKEVGGYVISELRRKARWFRKNMGLPRAIEKDIRRHAIGPGMFVIPATENEKIDTEYWEYWENAQKAADVTAKGSWYDYQATKVGMKFFDGDAHTRLVLSPTGFPQFQSIRSHNIGNFDLPSDDERWIEGVKRNGFHRHVAYRVKTKNGAVTVPAPFMLQSMLADDPDQVRGLTCLAHAINDLHDQLDILSLEKATVKDHGRISRVITNRQNWEDDEEDETLEEELLGVGADGVPLDDDPDALDPEVPVEKIWGSSVIRLAQNERLESFASNRPSPAFMGFLDWLGRNTTAGCGMPYEYSWDPTNLKSSAQRAIQNRIMACCREWQRSEERDTRKFYQFVILAGIARGDLRPNGQWWKCEVFPGAAEVSIDKGRDSRSDLELVRAGLLTLKAYYARQGKFWKVEARQAKAEAAYYESLKLGHPSQMQAQQAIGPAGTADPKEQEEEKAAA